MKIQYDYFNLKKNKLKVALKNVKSPYFLNLLQKGDQKSLIQTERKKKMEMVKEEIKKLEFKIIKLLWKMGKYKKSIKKARDYVGDILTEAYKMNDEFEAMK